MVDLASVGYRGSNVRWSRKMLALTRLPLWASGLLVIGLTLVSMTGPFLVRRRVELGRLRTNNEVAGFKFATVGVLYAVLLAFAVVVVWEKFSSAENAVAVEAGAAATVDRLSQGLPEANGADLRSKMTTYIQDIIAKDWPLMENGSSSKSVTDDLTAVYRAALTFEPRDSRDATLFAEILRELDKLTESRRARLVMAEGLVPPVLWTVLFGGAFVTIAFTFFFGTENIRAQAMMTGMLTILILSGMLIIITIDHPFAGPVKVEPLALAHVLDEFYDSHAD